MFELLRFLDLNQPSPAAQSVLVSALQALQAGDLGRAEDLAVIAKDVAQNSKPDDAAGVGLARMIVGLVMAERGDARHATRLLESAAFNLRRVLSWTGRWNEAICVAAIAAVELGWGNTGKAIALFYTAVSTLEKSRFYYGTKGMQARLAVMDELSGRLRQAAQGSVMYGLHGTLSPVGRGESIAWH